VPRAAGSSIDPRAASRDNSGEETDMTDGAEIDPKLLEILVCPVTKGTLRYDRARAELVSEGAGLAFPIRDGIPIMLVDEARKLEDAK
jgi:uncharacterized protein